MTRAFLGAILAMAVFAVLAASAIGEAPPPERYPLAIDAALQLGDLPKLIRPRPTPRPPRFKHSIV